MNPSVEVGASERVSAGLLATGALLVAVVDDDDLYRAYLSELLSRQGIRVVQAASGAELLDELADQPFDCVILDHNLGVETGLAIGEAVRGRYLDPPPIVMLTGEGGERTAVKAFRGGFSDYLSKKNLNPTELVNAVRGAVGRHIQEQSQRAEREELSRLVGRDPLTGLNAREYADALLGELGTRAKRRGVPFGLCLVRIHGFLQLQDRLGYVIADRVLRVFAGRLQKAARETDTVARYDGTTFIYIVDKDATPETMEAIERRLGRQMVFDVNFDEVSVKLAPVMGFGLFPKDGSEPSAVMEAADAQLAIAESGEAEPERRASGAMPTTTIISDRQTDRRQHRRQRVLKRAQIILKGLGSTLDCVVRDVSPTGALIRVTDYFSAPDEFDLFFLDTRITRRVEVRWQIGNDIGIRFIT
ncbi:MAG: diguanylate cyclase [Bauldia sp.]|nr:diguanylate cyclase [Bauldia sp.]